MAVGSLQLKKFAKTAPQKKAAEMIAKAQKEASEIVMNATNSAKKTDEMRREIKISEEKVSGRENGVLKNLKNWISERKKFAKMSRSLKL